MLIGPALIAILGDDNTLDTASLSEIWDIVRQESGCSPSEVVIDKNDPEDVQVATTPILVRGRVNDQLTRVYPSTIFALVLSEQGTKSDVFEALRKRPDYKNIPHRWLVKSGHRSEI